MAGSMITDIRHFTEVDPTIKLPRVLLKRRTFLGHIIQAATAGRRTEFLSGIPCRKRPNRKSCAGLISVQMTNVPGPFIFWLCPLCGDNGRISNFRGSWYDLGRYSIDSAVTDDIRLVAFRREEYAEWISGDMLTYDPVSLLLIYSALADGKSVLLSGSNRYIKGLVGAVAADMNHERKRRRKELMRSVHHRLFDALDAAT